MKKTLIFIFALIASVQLMAQPIIHSHNDYKQKVPFWEAYYHSLGSIEVDIYLRGDEIVVCHDADEVATAPTFEKLYIEPMVSLGDKELAFDLLIDFKSSASDLMQPFAELLEKYTNVFSKDRVKVIISGSRPNLKEWAQYADYILFDGRFNETYTESELAKVGMISDDLRNYTIWNGKGAIPYANKIVLEAAIEKSHKLGKPVRFWNSPDNPNYWLTLYKMGVDYTNTDNIAQCAHFFSVYDNNTYVLEEKLETYMPTFKNDGKNAKPKNIIFIIGDGMGLTHTTATETANRGELTVLNMKNVGFIKTYAVDCYNTDSAAAGSALATGKKTNNRYISVTPDGKDAENAAEYFASKGKKVGVVTSGSVTDATPATQYGHTIERDNSEDIALCMLNGNVDFLAGSNMASFNKRKDARNLLDELEGQGYTITDSKDDLSGMAGKVICLDEYFSKYVDEENVDYLAKVTKSAIENLDNKDGFYLMIESAKIDGGGHANNMRRCVLETLLMDAVVKEALEFADRDGNTLVVVTADHETGALTILDGNRQTGEVNGYFASDDHTGVLIPVYSYGPGAGEFRGIYENTDVFEKFKALQK